MTNCVWILPNIVSRSVRNRELFNITLSAHFFYPFTGGIAYLILAGQLHMGFPPFYRVMTGFLPWGSVEDDDEKERAIKRMLPIVFSLMGCVMMAVVTGWDFLFGLGGAIAI